VQDGGCSRASSTTRSQNKFNASELKAAFAECHSKLTSIGTY